MTKSLEVLGSAETTVGHVLSADHSARLQMHVQAGPLIAQKYIKLRLPNINRL